MRKFWSFLRRSAFLWALLLVFVIADPILVQLNPVGNSGLVHKDDYEITRELHPEKVWDKVFFGASGVTAGYDEAASRSGYVNLGMDYGVITDLYDMVCRGTIRIGSELVIGTDFLCFYDDLDTISSYIWNKPWYEPYVFFQRLRISGLITSGTTNLLHGKPFAANDFSAQEKSLYPGTVSQEEMQKKLARYEAEFWYLDSSAFDENLQALDDLLALCQEKGIHVRALWVPWNTDYEIPQIQYDVMERANAIYAEYGVEVLDLTTAFDPSYLHDLWHVNAESGRAHFMEVVDPWLCQD